MRPAPMAARATLWTGALLALGACNLGDSVALEAGVEEASQDSADVGDVETEPAVRPDGDGPAVDAGRDPGPLSLVISHVDVLEERLCDVDGDGLMDNCIADLGSPASTLMAAALTAGMGDVQPVESRIVLHLPSVDDRNGPTTASTPVITFIGVDLDSPPDPSDDFAGGEPYYVDAVSLDACGEPRSVTPGATITDGSFSAWSESFYMLVRAFGDGAVRNASITGTIEPGGSSGELQVCAFVLARDLGVAPGASGLSLTMLEMLAWGGSAIGMPSIPGVSPDIDGDGDGLETFRLDDEGHIAVCVDGDRSEIAGRECWRDDRIADGYSITVVLELVAARLAGLQPGWEGLVDGVCDEPPEQSLWQPDYDPSA